MSQLRQMFLWNLLNSTRGGGGLSFVGMAACYEEMNRSIFGPVAFNGAAPDDGNMMLLNRVAREDQKDRWLQPIVDGKVRMPIQARLSMERFIEAFDVIRNREVRGKVVLNIRE